MLDSDINNLLNTNIENRTGHNATHKTSVNKYYNIFSKKMEEIELPDINLEFNAVLIPEKSTFMRAG